MTENILVITGFGAFANVTDNPTQQIVKELQDSLPSITTEKTGGTKETIQIIYHILEVSVDYCESFISKLKAEHIGKELYFIHLGVDCNGETIKLEQFAYNNKTFRVPDYRGYQPQNEVIENENTFDLPLETSWNVNEILQSIHNKIIENNTVSNYFLKPSFLTISNDPGRYLCNYIYYRSLCQHLQHHHQYSLFVHVPEFSIISKEQQVNLVKLIVETLLLNVK